MRDQTSNFSLHTVCAPLIIVGLMAGMFLLLASGFVNTRHPSKQVDELQTIQEVIVGDPNGTTFGYLGDVGDYPGTLSDLISPSPVPRGWNGPYLRTAPIKYGVSFRKVPVVLQMYAGSHSDLRRRPEGDGRWQLHP